MPANFVAFNPGMTSGSTQSPGGGAIGLAPSDYSTAYGGRPNVPNPLATAQQAIAGNMGNLSQVYQMAQGINQFNTQAQLQDLMAKIPNYMSMMAKNSANIAAGQAGQLPQDVIRNMIQQMAERGVQRGTSGSPNDMAAYMRLLGTNTLALQNNAFNQLMQTQAGAPRIQPYDINQMMVSPDAMQSAAMAQSIYNSAPVPSAAAAAAKSAVTAGMGAGNYAMPSPVRVPGGNLGYNPGMTDSGPWSGLPTYSANSMAEGMLGGAPAYDAWNQWWGGGAPSAPYQDYGPQWSGTSFGDFGPQWVGSSFGDYGPTLGGPYNLYNDDIYDNLSSTSSYYDPMGDVSVNPASVGGGFWGDFDFGLNP